MTPRQLVALAAARGVSLLSVTDHDSVEGVDEALEAAREHKLLLVPGVEINTDVPAAEVHVLGYALDYRDREFLDRLKALREQRVDRGQKMVSRLSDVGVSISWDRVRELAGEGAVCRPHVAQAILEAGYVKTISEAFEKFIGRSGPAYVEREKIEPEEAVRVVVRAGGFAVLAHPHSFGIEKLGEYLDRLVPAGLKGIETYYGDYTPAQMELLASVARKRGLACSGGSDYHGFGGDHEVALGAVSIPHECLGSFMALAMQCRPGMFESWALMRSR